METIRLLISFDLWNENVKIIQRKNQNYIKSSVSFAGTKGNRLVTSIAKQRKMHKLYLEELKSNFLFELTSSNYIKSSPGR